MCSAETAEMIDIASIHISIATQSGSPFWFSLDWLESDDAVEGTEETVDGVSEYVANDVP